MIEKEDLHLWDDKLQYHLLHKLLYPLYELHTFQSHLKSHQSLQIEYHHFLSFGLFVLSFYL